MPAFDVTTNPTKLDPLKPGEKASVVVTATNQLPRAVTARAQKVVNPPSFDAMVKPPVPAQRMFSQKGATQDFTFTIEIPADASAGKFKTRFDIVDVEHQDDNFGQSSELEVVILRHEIPPPPPKKKWWIWVIVGVVVVGVGIGIWRLLSNGHEMPDVVRMTFADAKAAIDIDSARILRVDTLDLDTAAWHGDVVIRQSPPPGTSLEPETTTVRLVVQKPYSVVPTLMNLDAATAGAQIGAAGFTLGLASRCQTTASSQNGRVVQVRPQERTVQPRASTVTITILTVQPSCLIIHLDSVMIRREWERGTRIRVIIPNP